MNLSAEGATFMFYTRKKYMYEPFNKAEGNVYTVSYYRVHPIQEYISAVLIFLGLIEMTK